MSASINETITKGGEEPRLRLMGQLLRNAKPAATSELLRVLLPPPEAGAGVETSRFGSSSLGSVIVEQRQKISTRNRCSSPFKDTGNQERGNYLDGGPQTAEIDTDLICFMAVDACAGREKALDGELLVIVLIIT